jgi:hypothetical protein
VRDYAPIEDDETDKKFNCGAIPICFRARLPHICSIIAEKKPTKEERRERKLARDIPASSLKTFMTFVAEKIVYSIEYWLHIVKKIGNLCEKIDIFCKIYNTK